MEKKTSIYENGLIWFGAGVSIAEILTGTYYASMDFKSAILAIVIGHIGGFILMSLALLVQGRGFLQWRRLSLVLEGSVVYFLQS